MFFSSWLRKHNAKPRTSRRASSTFRPQLEVLEGRDVPSTLTVTNNLDDGSKGSLRYEIGKAHNGDTIVFAPSLDGQTITLRGSELDIAKNLTIQGPGAGLLTIDGGGASGPGGGSRIFQVERHTTVTISGLTIADGNGKGSAFWGYGGGILNLGTLTVSGCTISDNFTAYGHGYYGGGIYNAGTLTVRDSSVSDNRYNPWQPDPIAADLGGGIYNAGGATLAVSGCTFSYDAAGQGGGIYNAGTLTVSTSVFSNNYADNISGQYTDGGGNTFN
jgi:hypothetical protein